MVDHLAAVKYGDIRAKLGANAPRLDAFAASYTSRAGRVLSFGSFFTGEVGGLYRGNKQFAVQILNPRSYSAVNDSYSHSVGDQVRDQIVGATVKFYESKGLNVKIFEHQGINRIVLIEGVDADKAASLSAELGAKLDAARYDFEVCADEIEDPAARERFKAFIAKREGIKVADIDGKKKYKSYFAPNDNGSAPMQKKDGTIVKSVKINVAIIQVDPNSPQGKAYSPADVTSASVAALNNLNQNNPEGVQKLTLDVILRNAALVQYSQIAPGTDAIAALNELAANDKLQKLVLDSPVELHNYLKDHYKTLLPGTTAENVDSVSVERSNGSKTSPYVETAVGGKQVLVVPLLDASGKAVAEVRLHGKGADSFNAVSSKLGEIFTSQRRSLGGIAFKLSADLYLDPKSCFLNREGYERELVRTHNSGQRYLIVAGDLNSFGSWGVSFNRDFKILGTSLGDKLFEDFASRAKEYFRARGIEVEVARTGGDEIRFLFKGKEISKHGALRLLHGLGGEIALAMLPEDININDVPKEYQHLVKRSSSGHEGDVYKVNLYTFLRFSAKYAKEVKGMSISFGIHNAVDASDPNVRANVDPIKMDKEADGIANRAKNARANGNFAIALDRRGKKGEPVRAVVGDRDSLPAEEKVEVRASLNDPKAVKAALDKVEGEDRITFRSEEGVKVAASKANVSNWLAAEDLIGTKLKEVTDPLATWQASNILKQLPDNLTEFLKDGPKTIETPDGRKATVSIEGKGADMRIVITLEAKGEAKEMTLSFTSTEYLTLVKGKRAFSVIARSAVAQNPGVEPDVVLGKLLGAADRLRAGLGKPGVNVTLDIPMFEVTGTRAELDNVLLKPEITVTLGNGSRIKCRAGKIDLLALSSSKPDSPEYKAARDNLEKGLVADGMDPEKARSVMEKIEGDARLAYISNQSKVFFDGLARLEYLNTLDAELAKIEANREKMSAEDISKARESAYAKAGQRYALVAGMAYNALMARAASLDKPALPEAEVLKVYSEVAAEVKAQSDAIPVDRLETELKTVAEKFNVDPRGKGFSAYMDYFEYNAPGAGLGGKLASVGVNSGKAALMGFIVDLPFALAHHGLSGAALAEAAKSGLGFAKFEAISRSLQIASGMKAGSASAIAIGLTTLWDISSARPQDRGMVMVGGAVSLGGFVSFSHLAGLGVKFIPGPKWLKSGLTLFAGTAGAKLGEWGLTSGMEKSDTLRAIVTSPELNFVANGLSMAEPGLTALYAMRIGTSLLTRAGLSGGIGLLRFAGPIGAGLGVYFWGYGDNAEKINTAKYYRPLKPGNTNPGLVEWNAKDQPHFYSYAQDGSYYAHYNSAELPRRVSIIPANHPFAPSDPVMFGMAVLLRKQGYLADNTDFSKLYEALDGIDLTSDNPETQKKAAEGFAKYHELLSKNKNLLKIFTDEMTIGRIKFIKAARAKGYDLVDSQLSGPRRAGLGSDFVSFVVGQEENRYKALLGEADKAAGDFAAKYIDPLNDPKTLDAARKKFAGEKIVEIKQTFGVPDNKTALEIYKIAVDPQKEPAAAAEEIFNLTGGKVGKADIEVFVRSARVQKSVVEREVKLQRAVAAKTTWEYLRQMKYVEWLKSPEVSAYLKTNNIPLWKAVIGSDFKRMFARFLVEKKWRDEAKTKANEKIKDEAKAEEYMKKNWDFDRTRATADATALLPRLAVNGRFMLVALPDEVKAQFISYLRTQYPDLGDNPGFEPRTDFTPEMAMLLASGRLSKK